MKMDDLLTNPEVKTDSGDLSDDDQIAILSTLEESVSFVLQQWWVDDTNNFVLILSIQLGGEDHICLSYLPFHPENFALLDPDQSLEMTSDFVFTNDDTISDWAIMKKQAVKNVIEQQLQQVDQDLVTEYCNYNSEITLLPFLDVMDHEIWSIDRNRSIVGLDPSSNDVVDIIMAHLLLNTKQKIIVREIVHYTMCN